MESYGYNIIIINKKLNNKKPCLIIKINLRFNII